MCRGMSVTLAMVLFVAAAYAGTAEEGLIAHYNFDEGEGIILKDQAGNECHGVIQNAEYVKSGKGYALEFNGVDSMVEVPPSPALAAAKEAITLEVWIKPTAIDQGEPGILVARHSATAPLAITVYHKDKRAYFYTAMGQVNGQVATAQMALEKWAYLVATWDGETAAFYKNGKIVSQRRSKKPELLTDGLLIGRSGTSFYHGLMDDVRIYNRALTAEEVAAHFNASKAEKGMK